MKSYSELIEEAVDRLSTASDEEIQQSIEKRLLLSCFETRRVSLVRNNSCATDMVSICAEDENSLHYLETIYYCSTSTMREFFLRYLNSLLMVARVSSEFGFSQTQFNRFSRGEPEELYFSLMNSNNLRMIVLERDRFSIVESYFRDESHFRENMVDFEKRHLSFERLSSFSEETRDSLVKGVTA